MHFIFSFLCCFSILILTQSQSNSQKDLLSTYERLASLYCYIDDYPTWLEHQTTLYYLLEFAYLFDIDPNRIEEELKQYRLQRECLKLLERLPIVGGTG